MAKYSTSRIATQVETAKTLDFYHAGYAALLNITDSVILLECAKWCVSKKAKVIEKGRIKEAWGYRSCRQFAADCPYLGSPSTILRGFDRIAEAGYMRLDKSGGMNKHGYDYTIHFHVPPGVRKEMLDTKRHRSFLKTEAIEYGVLIAALRQNIRNQKDKDGRPINCLTAENSKVYHKMGKTALSPLMGVSPKSISNALGSEAFEKHPSLDGYYRISGEEGKNATPPSVDRNSEGKNATGRGQKRNDNTVSNKVSNAESFLEQGTPAAPPVPIQTNKEDKWGDPRFEEWIQEQTKKAENPVFEPITEKQIKAREVFNQSVNEGLAKLRDRMKTGKPLLDLSNVNNPDADDLGDLTDYEPLDLEAKVALVKEYITEAKLRWQGFRFSSDKRSFNELRKFLCCNPQREADFIPNLIGMCGYIQTMQPETQLEADGGIEGLVMQDPCLTQYKGEIGKYDAYRFLRQCHSLGFLFKHFEQIFAQVYYYQYKTGMAHQNLGLNDVATEYFQAIPTVYFWDNRNLHRDLNGKRQTCTVDRVTAEWFHNLNRKEEADSIKDERKAERRRLYAKRS